MSAAVPPTDPRAVSARAWRTAVLAKICDVLEPWEYGTIARATRYPTYFSFNLVRVEANAPLSAEPLRRVADEALGELSHRRLDFDFAGVGEAVRGAFEADGWRASRILWMLHDGSVPDAGADLAVEEVAYEEVHPLRVLWHGEDIPGGASNPAFYRHAHEVALTLGARVLTVRDNGVPVAFAQIQSTGGDAEVTNVYVHPERRGRGLGTAVTTAAIRMAAGPHDLWITADDQDRAKVLYARLGFRPVWTALEFTRLPE